VQSGWAVVILSGPRRLPKATRPRHRAYVRGIIRQSVSWCHRLRLARKQISRTSRHISRLGRSDRPRCVGPPRPRSIEGAALNRSGSESHHLSRPPRRTARIKAGCSCRRPRLPVHSGACPTAPDSSTLSRPVAQRLPTNTRADVPAGGAGPRSSRVRAREG
jgi:hypothetical protein